MASVLLKSVGDKSIHEIQKTIKNELKKFNSPQKDLIHKKYCEWETKMGSSLDKNRLLLEIIDACVNGGLNEDFLPTVSCTPANGSVRKLKKDSKKNLPEEEFQDLPKEIKNYAIRKVLGKGTFGKVLLAEKIGVGELVAIKVIDRKNVKTTKQSTSVSREIKLMKLLNHPHIIGVKEIIESKDYVMIVMEHADGGELFDYILNHGYLEEKEARRIFRQILSAVDYCHQNSVIHRDLKPENLLMDQNRNVKLIDFGFGNTYHRDRLLDTFCGSPFYAAPEMIQGIKYTGPEVDVWSLGVILFTLLSGRLPFDGSNLNELYDNIAAGRYRVPDTIKGDVVNLIQKMLEVDPKRRAKLYEIKQNSWVNRDCPQPIRNYINPERQALIPSPHPDSIKELTSYGFREDDCRNILANNIEQHPIKSLYYLIDEARIRENKKRLTAISSTSIANEPITLNTDVSSSSVNLASSSSFGSVSSKNKVAPMQNDHVIIDVDGDNCAVREAPNLNAAFEMLDLSDIQNTEDALSSREDKQENAKIKGFFVVSTTSSKKFHEITYRIELVLRKYGIEFRRPRFNEIYDCIDGERRPTHKFQIEIKDMDVKKTKVYKIEMRRVKGGVFEHSKLCRKLIQEMEL